MFKTFLKTTFRNMYKEKGYSFINIFTLSIGLTFIILITTFVRNELSYDEYHKNVDDIYYISKFYPNTTGSGSYGVTPGPLAQQMKNVFPEVLKAARVLPRGKVFINYKGNNFIDQPFYQADQDILDILTVNFKYGNKNMALSEPRSIIISNTTAKKYFNDNNPLGEILLVNNSYKFKVTGVFKDLPFNTHFRFDIMGSLTPNKSGWESNSYFTYARLKNKTSQLEFQEKLQIFLKKHSGDDRTDSIKIIPITKMFLYAGMQNPIQSNSNPIYIYILSCIGIALFIIIIFNYINMSIARSAKRIKEITIKKVIGAKRSQLIIQFIGESTLTLFLSFLVSIILAILFKPIFCSLIERQINLKFLNNIKSILFIMGLISIAGLISGIYPGLILSSKNPKTILQKKSFVRSSVRNSLVSLQFIISIVLIFSTLAIFKQLNFINNKSLGFRKNQIVNIPIRGNDAIKKIKVLKEIYNKHPRVKTCTNSSFLPNNIQSNYEVDWNGRDKSNEQMIWINYVDKNFLKTFDIELIKGKKLSGIPDNSAVTRFIINESAVNVFGFTAPLGQRIKIGEESGIIKGVMKDFHSRKLKHMVEPVALIIDENYPYARTISVRVNSGNLSDTISFLEEKYNEVFEGFPFSYKLFNDVIDKQYQVDQKLFKIIIFAALIVILISCFGLLGFTSYSLESRKKEIGIRKVLGSTSREILFTISKGYLMLITFAFIISIPISNYIMKKWLEQFAYHIHLGLSLFLYSGLSIILIAIITVGYRSIKTANINPIDSLRCE